MDLKIFSLTLYQLSYKGCCPCPRWPQTRFARITSLKYIVVQLDCDDHRHRDDEEIVDQVVADPHVADGTSQHDYAPDHQRVPKAEDLLPEYLQEQDVVDYHGADERQQVEGLGEEPALANGRRQVLLEVLLSEPVPAPDSLAQGLRLPPLAVLQPARSLGDLPQDGKDEFEHQSEDEQTQGENWHDESERSLEHALVQTADGRSDKVGQQDQIGHDAEAESHQLAAHILPVGGPPAELHPEDQTRGQHEAEGQQEGQGGGSAIGVGVDFPEHGPSDDDDESAIRKLKLGLVEGPVSDQQVEYGQTLPQNRGRWNHDQEAAEQNQGQHDSQVRQQVVLYPVRNLLPVELAGGNKPQRGVAQHEKHSQPQRNVGVSVQYRVVQQRLLSIRREYLQVGCLGFQAT